MSSCSILDISHIGKHYLVKSTSHLISPYGPSPAGEFNDTKPGIKRQYTEAFAMRKDIYDKLLVNEKGDYSADIMKAMKDNNLRDLSLTIKNYKL